MVGGGILPARHGDRPIAGVVVGLVPGVLGGVVGYLLLRRIDRAETDTA